MKNRNKYKRIVSSCIVMFCMACALFFHVKDTEATDNEIVYAPGYIYTASQYEVNGEQVAPDTPSAISGYLFAGWYTLPDDSTTYNPVEEPKDNEEYYAKFVPQEVLGIKAQVTTALIADEATSGTANSAIRFVTSVDSDLYKEVGFNIERPGKDAPYDTGNGVVYKELYAVGATKDNPGSVIAEYKPDMIFHEASEYFKTWTIGKIPATYYDADITIRPYWITLDGTRVEGTSAIKTVNLGRSWVYVDTEATQSDELGTHNDPYKSLDKAVKHPSEIAVKAIIKDSDAAGIENVTLDTAIVIDKTYPVTIASEAEATINRGNLANAMFSVSEGAELVLDGTLTLDGQSSSSTKATEAMLLNAGTLTIGKGVTIQKGYKTGNNSLVSDKTWNGGAVENIGTMNLYGMITNSGSSNGSAICSTNLDTEDDTVTLKIKDANLSGNVGRALRIVYGVATIEDTTINENDGANGGGALLIDYADVTIRGGSCNNNSSTSNGGAIKLTSTNAKLTLDSCTVSGNEAATEGGGIMLSKATNILTLKGTTTISDNVGTVGTQIYTYEADSTINWGSDVQMSAIDSDSKGMLGLNKASVKIVLAGAMNESNNISVVGKSSKLSAGNMILFGNNPWIENAADNFVVLSPSGLKVRIDGKLTSSDAETKVSTWSELKEIVAGATSGNTLEVVLDSDIPSTDEGAITIPEGVKVILTDEGKDYSITRTATTETELKDALFKVVANAEMILAGNITLDGTSSSDNMAYESLVLNQGTLTINSNVTIQNSYKEAEKTSLDETKASLSGGAIESNGTLNIYGTITACGSGNNSALSVLDGTFTANGAKLNKNQGRAARIVNGDTIFTNVEIMNNVASDNGAGLLIDYATVTIKGGSISSNQATGNGGAIVVQSTASLQTSDCMLNDNQATGQGGAFYINGDCIVTLNGCMVANNECVKRGGAVRIDKGTLNANDSHFNSNYGKQSGGALFVYDCANVELSSCKMNQNSSDNPGTTIHVMKSKNATPVLTLNNCMINDKSSENVDEGEIYNS